MFNVMAHAERDTVRHFEDILLAFATTMPALTQSVTRYGLFLLKKPRSGAIMVEKSGA
jgi:hypothetical protein